MVLLVALVIFNQNVWSRTVLSSVHANCTLDYDGNPLNEGQSVEIQGKLYKVEECGLHRAYHACGTYLLQMVSIACEILGKQRRSLGKTNRFRRFLQRRFLQRKLLTEACCETLCTVAEMTRYCP